MKQRKRLPYLFVLTTLCAAGATQAQELWKYTDKNGKVTYSDKAPKKGENAQLVPNDPAANIISAPKNAREGEQETVQSRKLEGERARTAERESKRNTLREVLEAAKVELELAKTALEGGRDPLAGEVQIVVGRSPTGAPTGANSQFRKPEYFARIASLETAVKNAEQKVEIAERNYRAAP